MSRCCTSPTCMRQLMPVYFREPSVNLGVGEAQGTAAASDRRGVSRALRHPAAKSAAAYALTLGGFRRAGADLRPASAGSTGWRPWSRRSAPSAATRCCCSTAATPGRARSAPTAASGQDMVDCMKLLKPDAMTGHWEFTYGEARVQGADRAPRLSVPGAQHARHRMERAGVRAATKCSRRAACKVAVLGQAFPYTPVANPRWMMPKWSFGIREEEVRAKVDEGAQGGRATGRAAVA